MMVSDFYELAGKYAVQDTNITGAFLLAVAVLMGWALMRACKRPPLEHLYIGLVTGLYIVLLVVVSAVRGLPA